MAEETDGLDAGDAGGQADWLVIAALEHQRIVADAAVETVSTVELAAEIGDIVASASADRILAAARQEGVVAIAAVEDVVAADRNLDSGGEDVQRRIGVIVAREVVREAVEHQLGSIGRPADMLRGSVRTKAEIGCRDQGYVAGD